MGQRFARSGGLSLLDRAAAQLDRVQREPLLDADGPVEGIEPRALAGGVVSADVGQQVEGAGGVAERLWQLSEPRRHQRLLVHELSFLQRRKALSLAGGFVRAPGLLELAEPDTDVAECLLHSRAIICCHVTYTTRRRERTLEEGGGLHVRVDARRSLARDA